jgi:hypothetical protein
LTAQGGMIQELRERQERAPKQAGTKNGKSLSTWTEKNIDDLNYRKNYILELESIRDDKNLKQTKKKRQKNY